MASRGRRTGEEVEADPEKVEMELPLPSCRPGSSRGRPPSHVICTPAAAGRGVVFVLGVAHFVLGVAQCVHKTVLAGSNN